MSNSEIIQFSNYSLLILMAKPPVRPSTCPHVRLSALLTFH